MSTDKCKNLPIKIVPDRNRIQLAQDYLLVCAGEETYHIDLEAFFLNAPMATLHSRYLEWSNAKNPEVRQRISEMKLREVDSE